MYYNFLLIVIQFGDTLGFANPFLTTKRGNANPVLIYLKDYFSPITRSNDLGCEMKKNV
jgi:hypothetical protein